MKMIKILQKNELLINGSIIIGVIVALDLISYFEIPVKPSKIKMFQELQ